MKPETFKRIKRKQKQEQDETSADAVLRIASQDVIEELDNMETYREHIREQYRLMED